MRKFILILLTSLLLGCSTESKLREKLNENVGRNIDEIIERAGPPTSTADLHNGNRVYAWQAYAPASFMENMAGNHGGHCNIRYTTDEDGIILRWSTYGNFCKAN